MSYTCEMHIHANKPPWAGKMAQHPPTSTQKGTEDCLLLQLEGPNTFLWPTNTLSSE